MFDMPDSKSFMDNVHGYIRIPKVFVKYIVDTPEFQRLRNVDQTGMKILYPAAKHDRFSHSLGVFHLGSIAVDALLENFQKNSHWKIRSDKTRDVFWAKNKILSLIACLLHDIGHAPFSHSLEQFYGFEAGEYSSKSPADDNAEKLKELLEIVSDAKSLAYFDNSKEHEKMSALLILSNHCPWRKRIEQILDALKEEKYPQQLMESDGEYDNLPPTITCDNLDEDVQFIARMILGVKYSDFSPEKQIQNCFIELLNGNFDVDKLDYTVRDTEMSGISNISLDIERLLSSLTIIPKTIYVDTNIEIKKKQQVIITRISCDENEALLIKGKFDREISAKACETMFPKGTHFVLKPKEPNKGIGVTTSGGEVLANSTVIQNGKRVLPVRDKLFIPTVTDDCLELDVDVLCDAVEIELNGSQTFKLLLDSSAATTSATLKGTIITEGSIGFSGDICGYVKHLEILSDELSEIGIPPSETCYTGFSLGFKKQAINLISNVTDARNYLYLWIYSHHKVIYYANYLIVELARLSVPKQKTSETLNVTMVDMMTDANSTYLLDDNFIHSNIRATYSHPNCDEYNRLFKEFISRVYRTSLFKSLAEFDLVFDGFSDAMKQKMRYYLESISTVLSEEANPQAIDNPYRLKSLFSSLKYGAIKPTTLAQMEYEGIKLSDVVSDMVWVASNPSLKRPSPSSIYISFGSKESPLITTMDRLPILKLEDLKAEQKYYFYLYYRERTENVQNAMGLSTGEKVKSIIREAFVDFMKSKLA
jgi:HD superfamily phosphohydrolase